ncbi:extracellular solute-binding protein [Brachybacterium sp. J153]|uniref:extracellular solute-binding protein n=1 Tax=Brachybacterium sp. J153 TaxID=3116488 RepID=UPI002E774847|nr:extracellular solute-binding protein [Brachybacterium sp. J153]MEE1618706.1 extracellular solute-binding protein [Brachybacterium sp. J153]
MPSMNRRSLLAAGAVAAAAAPALASCGSSSSGGSGGSSSGPLQFVLSGDANQGGGYAAMAAKYLEETGIEIEIVDVPYDDLGTKITNAARANDLPALARMPALDPAWLDRTADLAEIAGEVKPIEGMYAADADGKIPSLPSDLTAVGMFLNKDLWDQAGVAYPTSFEDQVWTWDEFVDAAGQVREATGIKFAMAMDRSSHRLNSFLYQFGSEGLALSEDMTSYSANEQTAPALEYFVGLNDDTFMPRSVWLSEDDPNAMFKTGQVAAYYSGSWQIADFDANIADFEWVSVPMPAQPEKATNFGTAAVVVVFEGTGQEQEALDFVRWLYQPENYGELSTISGFLPATEGVEVTYASRPEDFALYNEAIANTPAFVKTQKALALQVQAAGTAAPLDGDPLRDGIIQVINGETTVDAALSSALEQLNESLA